MELQHIKEELPTNNNLKITVILGIRRFDYYEIPPAEKVSICLDKSLDFNSLKAYIYKYLDIDDHEMKVVKLRNSEMCLVPLLKLLDENCSNSELTIDVSNVNYPTKNNSNLLQDAYLNAIRQKLTNMESRIRQAEVLLPHIQWKRQLHMDDIVNMLSCRVDFLNNRIDDLMPIQWRSKMSVTLS